MSRAFLGFLLAPLTPCIIVFIIALMQGGGDGGVWTMSLVVLIAYITAAVIGLPIHLLLVRLGHVSLAAYAIAGVLATFFPILFIFLIPAFSSEVTATPWAGILPVHYRIMAFMLLIGATVSTSFWLICRPDRVS